MTFIIIDYSKGNLRSVQKGFELAGAKAVISSSETDIRAAEALILPGVGSFADAAIAMEEMGQMQAIRDQIDAGVPFFGICLGMQLLFDCGNEGTPKGTWTQGLGILRGQCERITSTDAQGRSYKIPHVGWNQVIFSSQLGKLSENTELERLFAGIEDGSHFYFTHSYGCSPTQTKDVLATVTHANTFPCAVGKDKVFGVQFHPEKSSHKGLAVMANFVKLVKEGTSR